MNANVFQLAREVIRANPGIGKERLGLLLGCMPTNAAKMLARYQGEQIGHSTAADYQELLNLKKLNPDWYDVRFVAALEASRGIDEDRVRRLLARYEGATARTPELPPGTDWQSMVRTIGPRPNQEELLSWVRQAMQENPKVGIQKLGRLVGCRTFLARLLREHVRGETRDHASDTAKPPGHRLTWPL